MQYDDPIDRFMVSGKGMIVWAAICFTLFGLLAYGLDYLWFESAGGDDGRSALLSLTRLSFGRVAPWLVASPSAGVGLFFLWAASAVAREERDKKEVSGEEEPLAQ